MGSLACDIVLLPSKPIAQKAIETSQKLNNHPGSLFALNDIKVFAHSSLYMLQLTEGDIEKVTQLLASLAQVTAILNLEASQYASEDNFIDVEYEMSADLVALQTKVLELFNPIRDGMRPKDLARLAETTGIAHLNLEKYGYRAIGELFRPHVTFNRFRQNPEPFIETLPGLHQFDGKFDRIGLFEMGDNGTCVREIATFALIA